MTAAKVIPVSRLAPETKQSSTVVRRIVRELEAAGQIQPDWTSTGRGYLSLSDGMTVLDRLAR